MRILSQRSEAYVNPRRSAAKKPLLRRNSNIGAPLTNRIAVHVDADIDTVGERDDIAAMALWLGNQDDFNLVGFTTSPPDSNAQEYRNCINAYASDRSAIISKPGINADHFKTGPELLSLVVAGATADSPARGYRLPGESQYTGAHNAAQLLIANARNFGDPASADPTRKLWVAVQGGYVVLAQALYEAVVLGELPDICDRIRVVGQPNWNSSRAPNSWNYIFLNMWPTATTPGLFPNLWMLSGYYQWHAFNRDNGTTDTTLWNEVTANSSFGQHLRNTLTRPGGTFLTPHFRAGDAGIWFWLKSAKDLNNFNPENTENLCGTYRTYVGRNPWPSRTVGYGTTYHVNNPNPEGVTFSPTHWAPHLNIVDADGPDNYLAVNLTAWYNMVRVYMSRFQQARAPGAVSTPVVTGTGNTRTITWNAPADNGSPITDYVIKIDGVVINDGVGTSRTFTTDILGDGNHTATVAAVNAIGTGVDSPVASFAIGSASSALVFQLNEETGNTITSVNGVSGSVVNVSRGTNPPRLIFPSNSTGRGSVPAPSAAEDNSDHIYAALVRLTDLSSDRIFISRTGSNPSQQRHSQFRMSSTTGPGRLQYISTQYFESGPTTSDIISTEDNVVVINQWALFLAYVTLNRIQLHKNDAMLLDAELPRLQNRNTAMIGVPIQVGTRFNPSNATYPNSMIGDMGAFAIKWAATAQDVALIKAEMMAIAQSKGITLT